MAKQDIKETAYSLGLLCEGCDHHAKVVGFRYLPEAYAFAMHELGWLVEPGMVFCPNCRPDATISNEAIYNPIIEESPLKQRVRDDIVMGREVRCTSQEWPEIRDFLTEYIETLSKDKRWVYVGIAESERARLEKLYS